MHKKQTDKHTHFGRRASPKRASCSSFVLICIAHLSCSFHFFSPLFRFICVLLFFFCCCCFFFLPRNGQLRLDDTFELELTILHTQSFAQPSLLSHISVVAAAAAVMRIAVLHTLHCTHNKQQTTHSHRYLAGPLDSR